jgi:hypothetical protein
MGRQPKSLRRRVAQLHPRKTLLFFCEGARTEPEYLDALRRLPEVRNAAAVDIRIDRNSAGFKPLGLVRAAIAARDKAIREEALGDCGGETRAVACQKRHSSARRQSFERDASADRFGAAVGVTMGAEHTSGGPTGTMGG